MVKPLSLQITESADTLRQAMTQASDAVGRSKLQILWWLKSEQAQTLQQVITWSGYHRSTVSRWMKRYREGGIEALLEVQPRPGRPRAISGEIYEQLQRELKDPEGFDSYGEVQQWLSVVHGVEIPYKTVHKTVRYHLKAKLKVPRPVSEHQKAGAVNAFKQTSASNSSVSSVSDESDSPSVVSATGLVMRVALDC